MDKSGTSHQYFVASGGDADRMLRAYGWQPLQQSESKSRSLRAYSEWLSQPLDHPGPVLFPFPFPSGIERLFFYRLVRKGWPCIALIQHLEGTNRSLGVLKRFDVLIAADKAFSAPLEVYGKPVITVKSSLRKALNEALKLVGD